MNIRFLALTCLSILFSNLLFVTQVQSADRLIAKPIVFIDTSKAFNSENLDGLDVCLEWRDLSKKSRDLNSNSQGRSKEREALNKAFANLTRKFFAKAIDIGKNMGACAVLQKGACGGSNIYVNPSHDITKKVVEEINKTYVPYKSITSLRKCKSSLDMLHRAILNNSKDDIKLSIQSGANIDRGKGSKAPIFWAITFKKTEAVEYLLECGVNVQSSFIQLAINQGDIKSAVRLAEKCKENVDTIYLAGGISRGTLLQIAVCHNDWKSALDLVKKDADFSCNILNSDRISIMDAILHWGNTDVKLELIQELINKGYKASDIWDSAIKSRLDGLYLDASALKLFVENGADPNYIIRDPNPNIKGSFWTPLMQAINSNSISAVEVLLNSGANVNQKGIPSFNSHRFPQTSLTFAINLKNRKEIVELLLEHEAF